MLALDFASSDDHDKRRQLRCHGTLVSRAWTYATVVHLTRLQGREDNASVIVSRTVREADGGSDSASRRSRLPGAVQHHSVNAAAGLCGADSKRRRFSVLGGHTEEVASYLTYASGWCCKYSCSACSLALERKDSPPQFSPASCCESRVKARFCPLPLVPVPLTHAVVYKSVRSPHVQQPLPWLMHPAIPMLASSEEMSSSPRREASRATVECLVRTSCT